MKKNNKILILIFLMAIITFGQFKVFAQSAINEIEITSINTQNYPEISFNAKFFDASKNLISSISEEDLVVYEDNNIVDYTYQKVETGMKTSIVIDLGSWNRNTSSVNRAYKNFQLIENSAMTLINSMHQNDFIEIIFVRGREAEITQQFTNDKTLLTNVIQTINWEEEKNQTYGSSGIFTAYTNHINFDSKNNLTNNIVFFSSGNMNYNDSTELYELGKKLRNNHIYLYSMSFPWNSGNFNTERDLNFIFQNAVGLKLTYSDDSSFNDAIYKIDNSRYQYQFTFRSSSDSISERTLTIDTTNDVRKSAIENFSVPHNLIVSGDINIVVNNNEIINRKALDRSDDLSAIPLTEVPIIVTLSNFGNKEIDKIKLFIEGQERGNFISNNDGSYYFNWDIRDITIEGESTVILDIKVYDELGKSYKKSYTATINVIIPIAASQICEAAKVIPEIGENASALCYEWGLTTSSVLNLFLIIALIVLLIVMWRNKDKVAEVSRDVAARTTSVIQRMTNRWKSTEPKARLIAIKGIKESERQEYEIFGETPIGRNGEYAALILDNDNISRLHCTLYEGQIGGTWEIEDSESANGTFLNKVKLTPFKRQGIGDGDIIELCPVERGGVKFRFEILSKIDESLINEIEDKTNLNFSKTLYNSENNYEKSNSDNVEIENDPTDDANQRW